MEKDVAKKLNSLFKSFQELGDVYKDNDNFLFVTGRIKNLIILSNGKNISPEELEKKIYDICGVDEVIVKEENDKIYAEVYIKDSKKIDEQIELLNHQLPPYKRIAKIIYRDKEFDKTITKGYCSYEISNNWWR